MTLSLTQSVTQSVTDFYFCNKKSNPRDLWPLRHLIRVMRRHDLTKKDLPTYLPTSLHPYIREHHSRAYLSMTFSFLMYMGSGALLHILPLRHFIRVMRRHDLNFWPQFWPQFLTSIFDINFWPQFLTSIFGLNFWPQFLTSIVDLNFWPQFFTSIFYLNFLI